jgi:hypothetical protein
MYRTAKAQTQRDQIGAALPRHSQPALAQGTKQDHIPDVMADGVIVEVEASDTIKDDHTTRQWSLFPDYAAESGKTLSVVVPKGSVAAAQSRLTRCGSGARSKASDAKRRFAWAL